MQRDNIIDAALWPGLTDLMATMLLIFVLSSGLFAVLWLDSMENEIRWEIQAATLFDDCSAALQPRGEDTLANTGDQVRELAAARRIKWIRIVGHTDSRPLGPTCAVKFESNWHLAFARALAVKDFLVTRGVPAELFYLVGRGHHSPVDDNATASGRQRNRRIEIFLVY